MKLTIQEYNYADSGWPEHGIKHFIEFDYDVKTFWEIEQLFGLDFLDIYRKFTLKNNGMQSPFNDNLICFDNKKDCEKAIEELEPYLIMAQIIK